MSTYTILFIDDDPDVLRSLGNYFEELGHAVHQAPSGREGVALYERVKPDVTVCDFRMPEMSGMEVLESLVKRGATVIMLTARGEIEVSVEAMRRGAENFLVKPVDMSHLAATVEKAAEKTRLARENVKLKAQLHPNLKRRAMRLALLLLLLAISTGAGMMIGGGGQDGRPRSPIPIPLDSDDTAAVQQDSPLVPGRSGSQP